MDDRFGALQGALRGLNGFARNLTTFLMSTELHQASSNDLGQMALFIALGNLDGFVNFAVAKRSGDRGGECPRLLTRCAKCHGAVNHHTDGPARHDEQDSDHDLRQIAHLFPERNRVPTHRLLLQQLGPLDARLPGQRWIGRLYFLDQQALGHTLRHANSLRCSRFRDGNRRRADNAAYDATHLPTGDPAWHAAHHTRRHLWRSFFFLNHLNFLRDLGGRAELTVDDVGLNLLDHFHWSRSRGWRRRWRRRRHQERH